MRKHTVLIIDDDPDLSVLLQDIAESCGFSAHVNHDLDEVSQYIKENPVCLVILDLGIPSHDGVEFLRTFSDLRSQTPVVIISGHSEKVRTAALQLGLSYDLNMLAQFPKPISINDIKRIFDQVKSTFVVPDKESLSQAIESKSFEIQYQPVIHLQDSKITGLEALTRWRVNEKTLIYPDQFIPLAESTGLILPLTRLIVQMVFQHYVSLNGLNMQFSINLSSKNLNDLNLADEIFKLTAEYQVPPEMICFEVTETAVMSKPHVAMDILTRLRLKKFRISLDDFGTGYSSLVELHRLPFSEIKIDKSFVMNMVQDSQARKIASSIIDLGHSLELEVVAEGVEDKQTYDLLKEMGCDLVQGYYISRPLSLEFLREWLQKNCDANKQYKGID